MRWWLGLVAAGVATAACGDNVSGYVPWRLDPLSDYEGMWVRTPEFDVGAGEEIQDCYFFRVPPQSRGTLMVDRLHLALNPGSHHMNVFRVKTIRMLDPAAGSPIDLGGVRGTVVRGGECWEPPNWQNWPLVTNSQQSQEDDPVLVWNLPTGVATRFDPGEMLMMQVHYVNAVTQDTPYRGRAGINFYRSHDDDPMELGTLFATQQNVRVCRSDPRLTFDGTCSIPARTHTVAAVNGHFHSRGLRFSVYAWDGITTELPPTSARFYQSQRWSEPDMRTGLAVPLAPGGGIWWTCEYQWSEPPGGCAAIDALDPLHANDCCYTFGPTVETSEHCNVFLYYYPKSDDIDCF